MQEIRPIKADELEEFNRLVRIAFAPTTDHSIKMPEELTLDIYSSTTIYFKIGGIG